MENILVAIGSRHTAWEALSRACALCARVQASLKVLLVLPAPGKPQTPAETGLTKRMRQLLELRLEAAKAEGIPVTYFLAEGEYEEEVIRFAHGNRISLLIYELTEEDMRNPERESPSLRSIRHRIACRVETVSPKKPPL